MQDINAHFDSPLVLKISFDKLLQYYEALVKSDDPFLVEKAKRALKAGNSVPQLRSGFSDPEMLIKYAAEIKIILEDSFSGVLTENEIKTASMPLHSLIFNTSARFRSILENAGNGYHLRITNTSDNDLYRVGCILILYFYYHKKLSFKRPLFYEIPDSRGILRTYKIIYDTKFTEVLKTEAAPTITQADYELLLDNFEDIALWRQKFPPQSYIFKGFTINNIFDVTDDRSISDVKSTLLITGRRNSSNFIADFQMTFEALFNIKDLKIGFVLYDKSEASLKRVEGTNMVSYLLPKTDSVLAKTVLCDASYATLISDNDYFAISDVEDRYRQSYDPFYKELYDQGIRSAIFVPLSSQGELLGVLEIVSHQAFQLNSINANVLEDVRPFLVTSLMRYTEEEEHLIEAVIQQECTSIHPSVSWKFEDAARIFLAKKDAEGRRAAFDDIIFEEVYPLFGQIDVQRSSQMRNDATRRDMLLQLQLVKVILEDLYHLERLPVYHEQLEQLRFFMEAMEDQIKVNAEQEIIGFLKKQVHPLFDHLKQTNPKLKSSIERYFSKINPRLNLVYHYRKNYDETISLINKKMAQTLDRKQVEAQHMYPHYFERYKTDGVEHNIYIGESITKQHDFQKKYLYNLQLWQLQVMCDMENEFYRHKDHYPTLLDVASMVLVFHQPLAIQFRVDEKRFDVYGAYNARYEVVKKRVDKALVKGSSERATQKGKLTIIYSQPEDRVAYLQYIRFFQIKRILGDAVELLELGGLQGVTGLKAIRVPIIYDRPSSDAYFTYDDFLSEGGFCTT